MPGKILTAVFAAAGIAKRFAFQAQRPYTTADAQNVVPADPILGRDRGGSRPGLTKYHASSWGAPARCACIFTNIDGTRYIVAETTAAIVYSNIAGSANVGDGASSTERVQCVPFGTNVYFVGETGLNVPRSMIFNGSGPAGFSVLTPTGDPSVPFPSSIPRAIAVKYNRLWLAYGGDASGSSGLPSRFWASAVGDELDFDDAADITDPTTAYSAEINTTRDRITALIPWFGDYMVFATATSLYVLDGDPHPAGPRGTMRQVSTRLGIVDSASWTIGENNEIIALSGSGPIRLSPSAPLQEPELFMRENLPGVLTSPDTANYDHSIGYDSRSRRYFIFRSKISAAAGVDHYVLDLHVNGWWKYQFASTSHEPFCVLPVREVSSQRTDLLLFCRDGYARVFDETSSTDDGTAIASYLWLGPFRANDPRNDGVIKEICGTLAASSGSVTYGLYLGRNAEEAYAATAEWTGTFAAGRNPPDLPQLRCGTFYVKVSTSSARWAMEEIEITTQPGGRQRS